MNQAYAPKTNFLVAIAVGLAAALVWGSPLAQGSAAEPERLASIAWPREYTADGDTVIVYDPQVDAWEDYEKLSARSAVVLLPQESDREYYGVIEYDVQTEIDAENREVLFHDRRFTAIRFTGLDSTAAGQAETIARRLLPSADFIVPLDFVLAQVEAGAKTQRSATVNMDPPPIFAGEAPAILVMYLGQPEFKPLPGTDLQFCINTNWDLFLHTGTSQYFLLVGDGWLATKNLQKGPWALATTLPAAMSELPQDENWSEVRNNLPGKKIPVPRVFYTEQPAELIVTEGPVQYEDIPGTALSYVPNTTCHLFLHRDEKNYYFLTSGRWFRAKSLDGPWSGATQDLPADFGRIPGDSPKAGVRTSVPGTPEAQDAVLLAEVPHKAKVNPKDVSVTPTFDGEPKFEPIEETTVQYAVNSPYSVFLVGGQYYCCHDAVWFQAGAVEGPWTVCTVVPVEIYSIPSNHPTYNVTYVYVYDSTPDVVVVGYTAGYTGVYISSGVVVYGAAYPMVYPPYYYYHYYPYYYSYGCAMHYNYAYGTYYRSAHVYGPYGGAGYATAYNPHTGTYARGAYAYGPYGERHAAQSFNPYTGTYKARGGGSTPYSSWDRGVVSNGSQWARGGSYSDSRGTVGGIKTSEGGAIAGVKTDDGGAAVARSKNGDMYAAKDGNVYKKEDDGSWSAQDNGPSNRPAETGGAETADRAGKDQAGVSDNKAADPGARDKPQASGPKNGPKESGAKDSPKAANSSSLDSSYESRQRGNSNADNVNRSRSSGAQRSGGRRR